MPKYDNFDLDVQNTAIVSAANYGRYEASCSEHVAGTHIAICCFSDEPDGCHY